jgi:hypothetical protein
MAPKIDPASWTDVFGVLASVATAVPVLEAPLQGSIEALKQIRLYTKVSDFDQILLMLIPDCDMQRVKHNKEDSIALAEHAKEMTCKLFQTFQARSDLDTMKPSIEDFCR